MTTPSPEDNGGAGPMDNPADSNGGAGTISSPATPTPMSISTPTASAPAADAASSQCGFIPLVNVVDFHHARGPEVEKWFGVPEGRDPAADWDWSLLPFMALSDGAHAVTEDFSYFTLLRPAEGDAPATSLFGISCTRQLDASLLINRPPEVTRSTVQKAVVVIADSPQFFGMLRERLSVVTSAWFAQRDFTDCEILRRFQESLKEEKERGPINEEEDRDQYLGMSLRELLREFRWQTLVLLKCCLLQPKMLFFGSRCERLCMMQFSLVSLIPGLLRNLQDCAGPELDSYEKKISKPTSLRTSDRNSLLSYVGLPLQVFGKGSLFGPYTPLQQLDILADFGTKSYIVGSTNSLLLQQKDRYSDILINLDDNTINITSSSLRSALALTASDRRWIDFVTQEVNDTWDDKNPQRPSHMGYRGSEEFIRLQFEEYLLSLISSVKYHNHLAEHANNPKMLLPHVEGDPAVDYGLEWVEYWTKTENYRMWNNYTDSHIFDIVEPKHPCAGGLTIDDVQRKIQQQVQDLHLDERFAAGKEVLGRNAAAAREKASTVFNKFYADMEAMREAQRKRAEEKRVEEAKKEQAEQANAPTNTQTTSMGSKAGAYIGSWATWAGEKRKAGWSHRSSSSSANSASGGGWGLGRKLKTATESGSGRSTPIQSPVIGSGNGRFSTDKDRPVTQGSFDESILDGVPSDGGSSAPGSVRKQGRRVSVTSSNSDASHAQIKMIDDVISDRDAPVVTEIPAPKEDVKAPAASEEKAEDKTIPAEEKAEGKTAPAEEKAEVKTTPSEEKTEGKAGTATETTGDTRKSVEAGAEVSHAEP